MTRSGWLEPDKRPLDWNGPASRIFSRFRDEDLGRPIIEHFERLARRHPDLVAVADTQTILTFGQLWDGLSGLAETIAARTRPGDLIGILLPACPMFPLAMLACLAAGRPFVPLDPHYPDDWLDHVLKEAQPALIVGQGDQPGLLRLDRPPLAASEAWRPAELGQDEPACILFTSGSTGRPKGIVNSQRALLQRVAQSVNAAHIGPDDRLLTLASPCTIVGVRDALTALLAGASLHLLDPQRLDARAVLEVVRAEAITILFAFPALLRSIMAAGEGPVGGDLRMVRVGGDAVLWSDIDLLRAWLPPRAAIQVIFAATEAPMMQWFVDDACRGEDGRVPVGYPLAGNDLAVIDETGRPVPPGEPGELIVGGPFVRLGSWRGGRFAAEKAVSLGGTTRRLFRTGDIVRQRPDGLIDRLGRKDRQVKIRGVRVELEGVEAALRRHPMVRDAAVLARLGDDGERTLVAYVCARDGAGEDLPAGLRELMRSAPSPMRPARYYLVLEIPRLPSTKLDVAALSALDQDTARRDQAATGAPSGTGPWDADRTARTVARLWREALNTSVAAPDDDFFEAGGDSLKAVSFMLELERALKRDLPLTLINEAPTFAALCEAVKSQRSSRYNPLVLLKAGDGGAPVFFVHGAGGNVVDLFPIARAMTYPGAVFGIQARGLARQDAPHATVEAMASEYLRAVKARWPAGPYLLCGYSFGGLVAFEMARRLHEAGEEIGFVGLFDATASPLRWPLATWLAVARQRLLGSIVGVGDVFVRGWKTASPGVSIRRIRRGFPGVLDSAPPSVAKVAASAVLAAATYRPGFYPGELTLFTPAGRDPALPSPVALWAKRAGALRVIEIAGDHFTMLAAPNVDSAAAVLTGCLPPQ